jgi:hypothetical protein
MINHKLTGLAWLISCTSLFALVSCGHPADEKAAVDAADKWLKLVDNKQYGQSWIEASDHFRKRVKKERWESIMAAGRAPLGKVRERKVISTEYTNDGKLLPGSPDGEYVIIQFDTKFENKKMAVETVAPVKEKTGEWRVSGYFMR